ncbi:carbohydrate ABC transporter permease, partial [Klebsiella pneumoniae]
FAPEFRLLPGRWVGLENYRRALSASPLLRYLLNGGLVCAAIIICQLLIAVPCAYALAKIRFAGERLVWISVALGIAVPP